VASIARNKVLQQAAYHSAPRRDVRREQGLQSQLPEGDEQPELVAPVPGPDEAMSWFDALSLIRQRLKPDSFAIIAMKLEGYSIPEIARELGFARQTVSIRLRHIEGRLREILGRQSDESPDFGVADDEIFRE
jgi:DNA-directed RNA polymerase specialized sigma24 family protein